MKSKKIIIVLIIGVVFTAGCIRQPVKNEGNEPSASNPWTAPKGPPGQKGPTSPPPTDMFPPAGGETEEKCGLENCHGLEFSCGPNVPDFCTELYQLGDFCRQYAICEVIDGECRMVPNEKLEKCKTCVVECEDLGGEPAFECEAECREKVSE